MRWGSDRGGEFRMSGSEVRHRIERNESWTGQVRFIAPGAGEVAGSLQTQKVGCSAWQAR